MEPIFQEVTAVEEEKRALETCAVCGGELAPAEAERAPEGRADQLCDRCLDAWARDVDSHW